MSVMELGLVKHMAEDQKFLFQLLFAISSLIVVLILLL